MYPCTSQEHRTKTLYKRCKHGRACYETESAVFRSSIAARDRPHLPIIPVCPSDPRSVPVKKRDYLTQRGTPGRPSLIFVAVSIFVLQRILRE